MVKRSLVILGMVLALSLTAAKATPLSLTYDVKPVSSSLYRYDFTLKLTNADHSWAPGQGWGWIVFGDVPTPPSPLWLITFLYADAPFDSFWFTAGSHNGRNLGPVVGAPPSYPQVYWIPPAVGSALHWGGLSAVALAPDQMYFSALLVTGGAPMIYFQSADPNVPEPATLALWVGSVAAFWLMRRARRRACIRGK